MELTWMGRYRELVRALVFYSNASNRSIHARVRPSKSSELNQNEYQILEYICEFEDENRILTTIAKDTGILQSIVTKSAKRLVELGLAERYRLVGNKKSIVLKPTQKGRESYLHHAGNIREIFLPFFRSLEGFSDEDLQRFEASVRMLGGDWGDYSGPADAGLEKIP